MAVFRQLLCFKVLSLTQQANLLLCEVWGYIFFLLILVFLTTHMLQPLTPAPLPSLFLPPLLFRFLKERV